MIKLRALLMLVLLLSGQVLAANKTCYVDTGSSGGDGSTAATSGATAAYASLSAALTAEVAANADLTAAGMNGNLYVRLNRTNGGGVDSTAVAWNGFTEDATHRVYIIQTDFPANGVYDSTKYVLSCSDNSTGALRLQDQYTIVGPLQVKETVTADNAGVGVNISGPVAGGSDIQVTRVVVVGDCTGTGTGIGISINDADATVTITDCTVTGFKSASAPTDTGFRGIYGQAYTALTVYHCVSSANYSGLIDLSTATYKNCVSFNNTDDLNAASATVSYCALDDADSFTGKVDISPGATEADDWNAAFTSYATGDFSVKDISSVLYRTGNSAGVSADIIGASWANPPSIGAYEFGTASSSAAQLIFVIED